MGWEYFWKNLVFGVTDFWILPSGGRGKNDEMLPWAQRKKNKVVVFEQKLWSCPLRTGCMGQNGISVYQTINLKTFTIIQSSFRKVLFQSAISNSTLSVGVLLQWSYCTAHTSPALLVLSIVMHLLWQCYVYHKQKLTFQRTTAKDLIQDFCTFSLHQCSIQIMSASWGFNWCLIDFTVRQETVVCRNFTGTYALCLLRNLCPVSVFLLFYYYLITIF